MSNFEHWIKKDSTEFEKAFLKIYDGNLWDALEKMKDWQPPKPLVVVPQLVADFIEERKESLKLYGAFHEIDESYGTGTELYDWLFASVDSQELFARAWLDGYTVEKEQLYKVVFMDKIEYTIFSKEEDGTSSFGTPLTEQEIKAIDERYWPFAIKVDEVEPRKTQKLS